jgi:hypothetical protein
MFRFVSSLSRPQPADEHHCPICLEALLDGRTETCENGHRMHRVCAMQMHFHMTSQCPLCRSMLVCSSCGSQKRNMRCNCSGIPKQPAHGWTMVKYQICLLLALLLVPYKDSTSISLVCAVNFGTMIIGLITPEPKKKPINNPPVRSSNSFLIMKEIGLEVIRELIISSSISTVYSWCVGQVWSNI